MRRHRPADARALSPRRLHRRRGPARRRDAPAHEAGAGRADRTRARRVRRTTTSTTSSRRTRAAQPRVRRIKKPHLVHPVFAEFMRSPRLLAVLSALLGPSGVRLHGSKLNLKAPEYGSPVEWHQDWAFYPHTNDDLLAVGVLLDDATEQNGPLLVLPGSHRGPTYDHHGRDGHFCGAMDPARDALDFAAALPLIAPAGSCSFHHVRAVHGSAQNRSAHSRNLLLYEFAAADAFPLLGVPRLGRVQRAGCWSATPTVVPRTVDCPIRMPLPPAKNQGSIYENQTALAAPLLRPAGRRAARAAADLNRHPKETHMMKTRPARPCSPPALLLRRARAGADHADLRRLRRARLDPRPAERALHRLRQRQGGRQGEGQLHPGRAARQRRAGDRADDAGLGADLRRRARLVRQLGQGLRDPRLGLHLPRRRPHAEVPRQPDLRGDGREAAQGAGPAHPRRRADAAAHPVLEEADRLAERPERREDARARDQDLPHAVGDARHAAVAAGLGRDLPRAEDRRRRGRRRADLVGLRGQVPRGGDRT